MEGQEVLLSFAYSSLTCAHVFCLFNCVLPIGSRVPSTPCCCFLFSHLLAWVYITHNISYSFILLKMKIPLPKPGEQFKISTRLKALTLELTSGRALSSNPLGYLLSELQITVVHQTLGNLGNHNNDSNQNVTNLPI